MKEAALSAACITVRRCADFAARTVALCFALHSIALAQQTPIEAPNPIDLRPLYANSMDIEEGRRLAQGPCATCHGRDGVSTITEVPHLAAQRSPYLYREMRAYLSGARGSDVMGGTITFLSADALINVAAYYASLDPAPPAPPGGPGEVDPVQAGRTLAAGCAACHGEFGISKTPGIPSLVAQEPKYLVAAMGQYKDGERKNDMMKAAVAALGDDNMANAGLFYALQNAARAQTPAQGNAAAGQALAQPCAACHGAEGISGNPSSPSLAGQDAQYLVSALKGYQDGGRGNTTMKALAASLDDTAIKNLAAYYAGLQPQRPNVRRPLATAEWVERCDRCHGVGGNSTDPRMPMLAAQREDYLRKVLDKYRTGARRSPEMAAMSEALSENDVRNLAIYYSRQKARAVIYVPTPAK
jgi:cytochrome c553